MKTVSTDENTVGLDPDFYRNGDGNDESFAAQMIVSAEDLAPDIAGIQNVWFRASGVPRRSRTSAPDGNPQGGDHGND